MSCLALILELFGGLILLFAIGWFIGRLLKLDEYYEEYQQKRFRKPTH